LGWQFMALSPIESLQAIWPPKRWRDVSVVVGVSGGADSVALLCLLNQIAQAQSHTGTLIIAHYNHLLRGIESDLDERFVRDLANRLNLPCVVERAGEGPSNDANSNDSVAGSEEDWREQRYAFFGRVACKTGARYVALAHHGDDRVETVLHHIFRGTGITGLAAMKPFRGLGEEVVIARPLLHSDRKAIHAYLAQTGLGFREDLSNANNRFTRNKLRNQLIPFLDEIGFVNHRAAILRLAEQATEIEEWIERIVDELYEFMVMEDAGEATVKCEEVGKQPRPVQRQLLLRLWKRNNWPLGAMNAQAWNRLFSMISSEVEGEAMVHLPGGVWAKRLGTVLKLGLL
jgi:tRNA(Ile)-lysidine synthase